MSLNKCKCYRGYGRSRYQCSPIFSCGPRDAKAREPAQPQCGHDLMLPLGKHDTGT